jgi:kynureninase
MIKGQEVGARSREDAQALDQADPLRAFRDRFSIDDDTLVYLDGNSLGRLPKATVTRAADTVAHWGKRIVQAWEDGWLELPEQIGDRLGTAALGAAPGQTVIGDSTTVCFYKLASAALDAGNAAPTAGTDQSSGRTEILTDVDNFPTDRYVLEGLAKARGLSIRWLRFDPAAGPTAAQTAPAINENTALVTFSHVSYRSAHIAEAEQINRLAHDAGALTLWDLSHSAGSVPVDLDHEQTDLAVGCTYKYLNGGPGAPAYMYVRRELQEQLSQPIWGWLGRADPFEMEPGYVPAAGMRQFLSGTPPVQALQAVDEGITLVAEAGIDAIRAKGIALTEFAIELADARLAQRGVSVASPRDPARRGAHVALAHTDAHRLTAALIARKVIPDFRRPDVIRFGLSPLTTQFVDVWDGVEVLDQLLSGD